MKLRVTIEYDITLGLYEATTSGGRTFRFMDPASDRIVNILAELRKEAYEAERQKREALGQSTMDLDEILKKVQAFYERGGRVQKVGVAKAPPLTLDDLEIEG